MAGRGGNQLSGTAADALAPNAHVQRTLAAHKKRKRRAKTPGATTPTPDDASAPEPDASDTKDKPSGGEPAAPAQESAAPAAESPADAPEPEKKRKKSRSGDDAQAGEEAAVSAKAEPTDQPMPRPEALAVSVGPRVTARSLTYVQDIYNRNAKYSVPGAPALAATVDFYPGALTTDGFIANLGLTADVSYLLPVVSTSPVSGPGSYTAHSLTWSAGAKVRLPMGAYVTVAYGEQRFELVASGGAPANVLPVTDYKFVRAGAGIRYLATPALSLMVNAAFLHCLSLGQIGGASYYPKGTGNAFEGGVALGYRISSTIELRGGGDVRRYGLAFHQNANDADLANALTDPTKKVAGGAVDQYLSGWVALAVILDGQSSHGGGRRHGGAASRPVPAEEPE